MEQQPPLPETPPPEELSPPAQSLMGRLVNVFADPGDVFAQVKGAPVRAANWLVPALLVIAVSWVAVALIFSQDVFRHQVSDMVDKKIQKSIEQQHLPADQAEKGAEVGRKIGSVMAIVGGVAGPVFGAFVSPFLWGLILWGVGVRAFKARFSYMKAVEVTGLTAMISVLEVVVRVLLVFGLGNVMASPSAGMLVKDFDPQRPLDAALAAINVMTIWVLALRSLGLARISSVSFARAAAWVFGVWVAFMGLSVGFAALGQALGQAAHKH